TGWLVVDCDIKRSNGIAWFLNYAAERGADLSGNPYVETPSGGRHYIFRNPDGLGCARGSLPEKDIADIDIKGNGGYVIGAGAVLTNGMGDYTAHGDVFYAPPVPAWLHELLSPPQPVAVAPIAFRVAPSESTNDRLREYGQKALDEEIQDLAAEPFG